MQEKPYFEGADRAQSKVDAQRDKIAKMAPDDPMRADEERILDILIKNAQLAATAHLLLEEDYNAPLCKPTVANDIAGDSDT